MSPNKRLGRITRKLPRRIEEAKKILSKIENEGYTPSHGEIKTLVKVLAIEPPGAYIEWKERVWGALSVVGDKNEVAKEAIIKHLSELLGRDPTMPERIAEIIGRVDEKGKKAKLN